MKKVGVPRSDIYHCVKSSILINDKSSDVQTRIYEHKYAGTEDKRFFNGRTFYSLNQ